MPVQQSTAFWKSLGVDIRGRQKVIRTNKPKQDMAALKRLGVSQVAIDSVYALCLRYNDALLFKKFSKFFRKDVETVKVWTNTTTSTGAFNKLFNIFHKNSLDDARKKFSELFLIFQFYNKGEHQMYSGKVSSSFDLKTFKTRTVRARLARSGKEIEYKEKGISQFGKERIIWLQKNTNGKKTDKFIKLSRHRNKIIATLSFDSKKEYYIVKHELERHFDVFLETPQSSGDFKKLFSFLQTGISPHFILSGSTHLESEFRVSIVPLQNRIENVADLSIYKVRIGTNTDKLSHLTQLRISYKDKTLNKPIFISILSYREGIFGALLLRFDDKKLTTVQRKRFYTDFKKDFALPVNEFLSYDNLTEKKIYQLLLESVSSKVSKIELRSPSALAIYTSLVNEGLIESNNTTEEVSKVCINATCTEYFKPVWDTKKYCSKCRELLINGRSIEIRTFDEKAIALFLKNTITGGTVSNSTKKLLSRTIVVSQVIINGEVIDFIPVTKPFNDNQLLVLQLRYPHAVLITTRQDKGDLIAKGFRAVSLWELVHSIQKDNSGIVNGFARKARVRSLSAMRALCETSVDRIANTDYYKERNDDVTNLGAEMFEADCSILFDYVFGNCLWLGTKYRGASLPDGFTAFPMLETMDGCFIWDGKFSEGAILQMGKFSKNRHYIEEARKNQSIKDNGGLKGFVFVSNNVFPPSFTKKYRSLTKGKRLKVSFIRASQVQRIVEHFQHNENLILNNSKARRRFSDSMIDLFFTTTNNRKCEIITDNMLDTHIKDNDSYFATLRAGRRLRA